MNNEWFNEIIGQVQEEMERLKELSTACEKQEVYYKTMISTHEVTIGQQAIWIKKQEKAVGELKIDSNNRQTAIDIERKKLISVMADVNKQEELPRLVSQLTEAQEVVSTNVNTILHLQEQLKEMDEYAQEGWDLAETYRLETQNLETDIHTLEINGGDSDTTEAHIQYDRVAKAHNSLRNKEEAELNAIVDEQVTEIKNLRMDVKQLQDTIDQLWGRILGDSESRLTDESLILQYTGVAEDTPTDVSAIYREKYPSAFKPATEDTLFPGNETPEPHPNTNPIREVPVSGRVKEKK
jgi:hypothetical protein